MKPPKEWKSEAQLRGLQSRVQAAINSCTDGAYIQLDLTTGYSLIRAIEQARWIEQAHESGEYRDA